MASRVLVRCVRILSRTCSHTRVVTSRLQPVLVSEVHRAPLWATVGEKHLGGTRTVKKGDKYLALSPRTPLDDLVDKATESEDILQAWEEHPGSGDQAGRTLITWSVLVTKTKGRFEDQPPELLEDPRLLNLLTTLSQEVGSVWNINLVGSLKALWMMNLPPTHPVLNSLQTETLWRIRKFNYKQLSTLIDWGVGRVEEQDQVILNAALKQLELRWTEIADARVVSILIPKGKHMSPTLLDRLEDKALEFAEGFSAEDIRRICVGLAAQSRRSVPLLRALTHHLLQKPSLDFTAPLMLDVAFALGKLNFHHTPVFQRMASELLPRAAELSPIQVVSLSKSFSLLKWLHLILFEAFAENYIINNKDYSPVQLSNLLMAFARLNFQPNKAEEFYTKVHSFLENSLSDLRPHLQTDVAWSLCVLEQARPQYLIPLLKERHISAVTDRFPAQRENYRLKLLHIAASLQLEHPGSFDTVASQKALISLEGFISGLTPLTITLREALHNLVGNRKDALRVSVDTVYGWTIDGEIVVDSDNKPVSLTSFEAPHLPSGAGTSPLPKGARRIAVLAWEFPNFTSKSKDLLGRFAMKKRHLQRAGFTTVEVPYFDWLPLQTGHQRVSYLKDKIGKAVAEDMAK